MTTSCKDANISVFEILLIPLCFVSFAFLESCLTCPLLFILEWKKMTVSETCSGIVVVHSNENRGQVSFDGWTNTDGDRLCKDLECGSVKSNQNYSTSEKHSVWGKTFNCTYQNNTENIWDCETQNSSSQQLLSIDCRGKIYFCRIAVVLCSCIGNHFKVGQDT